MHLSPDEAEMACIFGMTGSRQTPASPAAGYGCRASTQAGGFTASFQPRLARGRQQCAPGLSVCRFYGLTPYGPRLLWIVGDSRLGQTERLRGEREADMARKDFDDWAGQVYGAKSNEELKRCLLYTSPSPRDS